VTAFEPRAARRWREILSTPLSSPSFVLLAAGPSLLLKASPRKQFLFVPGDERRSCRTQELENGVPPGGDASPKKALEPPLKRGLLSSQKVSGS